MNQQSIINMDRKYLFSGAAALPDIPYNAIIVAYFVELINNLINEVNDIAETQELVPVEDVQEYVSSELDFDYDEILQDVLELLPIGTQVTPDEVFEIADIVQADLLEQYA